MNAPTNPTSDPPARAGTSCDRVGFDLWAAQDAILEPPSPAMIDEAMSALDVGALYHGPYAMVAPILPENMSDEEREAIHRKAFSKVFRPDLPPTPRIPSPAACCDLDPELRAFLGERPAYLGEIEEFPNAAACSGTRHPQPPATPRQED